VWEPSLAAWPQLDPLAAGRSRLPHLRRDLLALGLAAAEVEALPRCEAAAGLARTPASTLGALYVVEGSTLGGQVIARALAGRPWVPAGGLIYFSPYGAETGRMWRTVQAALNAAPAREQAQVVAGALEAFDVLHAWMAQRVEPAGRSAAVGVAVAG
jgi:heme oxygenase (biliverdin-IX-beta and delta-forming)